MKRKKIIQSLGVILATGVPISMLVACGSGTPTNDSKPSGGGNPTIPPKPTKTNQEILTDAFNFLNNISSNLKTKNILPSSESATPANVLSQIFNISSQNKTKYFKNINITNLQLQPNNTNGHLTINFNLQLNNETKVFTKVLTNYLNSAKFQDYQDEQFFENQMNWRYSGGSTWKLHKKIAPIILVKVTDPTYTSLDISDFDDRSNNNGATTLTTYTQGADLNVNNHQKFVDALANFVNVKTLPKIFQDYPDLKINDVTYNAPHGALFASTSEYHRFIPKYLDFPGGSYIYDIELKKGNIKKIAWLILYGFKAGSNAPSWTTFDWNKEEVVSTVPNVASKVFKLPNNFTKANLPALQQEWDQFVAANKSKKVEMVFQYKGKKAQAFFEITSDGRVRQFQGQTGDDYNPINITIEKTFKNIMSKDIFSFNELQTLF